MELTLLGTGTPQPNPLLAWPSQHIQLGDSSVLVDAGSGVLTTLEVVGTGGCISDLIILL